MLCTSLGSWSSQGALSQRFLERETRGPRSSFHQLHPEQLRAFLARLCSHCSVLHAFSLLTCIFHSRVFHLESSLLSGECGGQKLDRAAYGHPQLNRSRDTRADGQTGSEAHTIFNSRLSLSALQINEVVLCSPAGISGNTSIWYG